MVPAHRETKSAVSYKNRKGKRVRLEKKKNCSHFLKTSSTMSVVLTSCACLYQVTGRSSATSVASRSPRRETCCDTSSCTQAKNPSNAPSAATPAGGAMPSRVICALMLVRLLLTLFSSLFTHPLLLPRRGLISFLRSASVIWKKDRPIMILMLGFTFYFKRYIWDIPVLKYLFPIILCLCYILSHCYMCVLNHPSLALT